MSLNALLGDYTLQNVVMGAAMLVLVTNLKTTFALTGGVGVVLALLWMWRRGRQKLEPFRST